MKKPKRQHTVPRCYLENFADQNGHVWVLDTKDHVFNIKPKNIFVENNFYTITLKNGEKSLVIEDTLANIESAYASIYANKISHDLFLTDEERAAVSVFIAALFVRTKPYRENLRKSLSGMMEWMQEWKRDVEENPEIKKSLSAMPSSGSGKGISLDDLEKYMENFNEEHSVSIISQLPHISQIIFDMKWSVMKNKDGCFVTCDNPLVLMRPAAIMKYGPSAIGSRAGLLHKDVDVTLPLSKDRLLLAGWVLTQDSYTPVDNDIAWKINYRTITHSHERVIADSEEKVITIKNKYTETAYKKAERNKNT